MPTHEITGIVPGSIAEEMGVEPGDTLLSVNGREVEDVFDYRFAINDVKCTILVLKKKEQEEWELEIEKDLAEDIGLEFAEGLMDAYRSCRNDCIFCFIDQMPPGMRDTLYFKDDDARLSFLQGNYITLTNMSGKDFSRVLQYHLSPVNISVHATNPELRCRMLHNRFAGDIMEKLRRLRDGGIDMNSQIVLCKGINDGAELTRTVRDLFTLQPQMQGLSVVPVGLTRFREHLPELVPFTGEDAARVLDQLEGLQQECLAAAGSRFVFPSDEWFLLAGRPIPDEAYYEGYGQLENGVGMVRSLTEEVHSYLKNIPAHVVDRTITLATGVLAAPVIRQLTEEIAEKAQGLRAEVVPVINHYFGERITVAGLLTGKDLIEQLSGRDLGEALLLPECLLRNGEDVLLDDITVPQIAETLQTKINIVQSDGISFTDAVLGIEENGSN